VGHAPRAVCAVAGGFMWSQFYGFLSLNSAVVAPRTLKPGRAGLEVLRLRLPVFGLAARCGRRSSRRNWLGSIAPLRRASPDRRNFFDAEPLSAIVSNALATAIPRARRSC